jgi:hypothetical protein
MVVATSDLDCPYNGESAHGGRSVHAFASPGRYSARLGAGPRSTRPSQATAAISIVVRAGPAGADA